MEPSWTRSISNKTICNFFYTFFVVYAFLGALSVVGFIGLFFMKLPPNVIIANGFTTLLTMGLATTMALFHYLICDRALKPGAL
jgi:hypothetical protein